MTREEDAFIGGVELAMDWNLYVPLEDHVRYDELIRKKIKEEEENELGINDEITSTLERGSVYHKR